MARCLLYYITDRTAFPGPELARRRRMLEKIAEAAHHGVDYIQLREKDLSSRELELLAIEAMSIVRRAKQLVTGNRPLAPAVLINSRTDVVLAAGADGVHLRSQDISPSEVRRIWKCRAGAPARQLSPRDPLIAISCHSPAEVFQAAADTVDFAVFAPVFEKKDAPGTRTVGLAALAEACRSKIPVLALGGVNLANAQSCLAAGAAGIAAIRLFQENDIGKIVEALNRA